MPILPRSCELLDWYGTTFAYGTLQQGGRASRDFYNILIDEIVHLTENGPLEDAVTAITASETDMQQELVQEAMRNYIEIPAIGGVPAIELPVVSAPAVGAHAIGSSSSATKIRAAVVRVFSQLEEHGKMLLKLDDHGKRL
ncbi:hypothetical protein GIB67_004994 [Kingdonia uniflora]|uniref:Uncharacterized protein n=1 Tax=Kingdonia uniflora TaxID=39325 RepID=A0A7J7NNB5_9MAGN|nr:hypothetical protein GIB67_004994 [Kingdonia uniflora]